MAISGLVITLSEDAERAGFALRQLELDARLELGLRAGRRLAAVADTQSPAADRLLWHELRETRGVIHVDVVYVRFEDQRPQPSERES